MKKIITLLILSTFLIGTPVNAKTYKKNWCSGIMPAKFGFYSLGCDLSLDKAYYPLRGKNWIYSSDTFGFEAGNELKNPFKQYDIKIKISIIKGNAKKIKPTYYLAKNGVFKHHNLSYKSRVDGSDDFWSALPKAKYM